jgi:hypothetical protein
LDASHFNYLLANRGFDVTCTETAELLYFGAYSAPFAPGRPNQSGTKGRQQCFARIALLSSAFLGQDAESRATPNGNGYTRFSLATSVSWKENGSTNTRRPPNGIASSAGTSWRNGQVACGKAHTSKKANCDIANILPLNPIAAFACADLCEFDSGARPRCRTSQFLFSRLTCR